MFCISWSVKTVFWQFLSKFLTQAGYSFRFDFTEDFGVDEVREDGLRADDVDSGAQLFAGLRLDLTLSDSWFLVNVILNDLLQGFGVTFHIGLFVGVQAWGRMDFVTTTVSSFGVRSFGVVSTDVLKQMRLSIVLFVRLPHRRALRRPELQWSMERQLRQQPVVLGNRLELGLQPGQMVVLKG